MQPDDYSASDNSTDLDGEPSDDISPLRMQVDANAAGQRLDRLLSGWLSSHSRARLQGWIEEGAVLVNGQVVRPSRVLRALDWIDVNPPAPEPQGEWLAEPMPLVILHEDESVLVVNKPAGLVVHPAAGHAHGTLLNGLLHHCPALREVPRAGIVHRLDQDTTGLMVVAKTLEAQTELVRQLQARTVQRRYLALAWGELRQQRSVIGQLGRDPRDRQRMAVLPEPQGKPATTHLQPKAVGLWENKAVSLIECRLETGRTHQIRVHLQSIGLPILGDQTYRQAAPRLSLPGGWARQALHAASLRFDHPVTGDAVLVQAAPPADFQDLVAAVGISLDDLVLVHD
ncbi:MAG: RluA family pseudouridine synthase [Burkholderiaceae bacterium]